MHGLERCLVSDPRFVSRLNTSLIPEAGDRTLVRLWSRRDGSLLFPDRVRWTFDHSLSLAWIATQFVACSGLLATGNGPLNLDRGRRMLHTGTRLVVLPMHLRLVYF
jgi:hypothetical protein